MKRTLATLLFLLPILIGAICGQNIRSPSDGNEKATADNSESMSDTLVIKIGSRTFTGTLLPNPTAKAFKAMYCMKQNVLKDQ